MRSVEEVALYALLLREAAANRHTSPESLLDDFGCEEDRNISFAALLAHEHFSELDWELVQLLCDKPDEVVEVARVLYSEHEQVVEAEALLHAMLPNGKRSRAQWARPINARWREVRASMRAYETEWLTTSFAQIKEIAKAAFMAARPEVTDFDWWLLFGQTEDDPARLGEDFSPIDYTRAARHARFATVADDD